MSEILKEKRLDKAPNARNLFAGIVQFLGFITLVFSIQDIIRTGSWRKVVEMMTSANGRLLIIAAGIVAFLAGWYFRHQSQNGE